MHYKADALSLVWRVVLFGTISVYIRIFPSYLVLGDRFQSEGAMLREENYKSATISLISMQS